VSTFDNLKTGCKPDKHWGLTTCQPFHKKIAVKNKIVEEKKTTRNTIGQCKAIVVPFNNTEKKIHQNLEKYSQS